jgi:carboxylate-amine ligase
VKPELLTTMVEIASPVCRDLDRARAWLLAARRTLSGICERVGVRLVSVGAAPRSHDGDAAMTSDPRFARMREQYGPLVEVAGLCACHVHVGIDDPALVLEACNRVRPWLPVLHALTANSPFADDRDTGYASWRSILWTRWPSAGPPPMLRSPAHYDRVVRSLIDSGAMLDPRMIYWYARPSVRYPTLEIRAGDACATVDETILVAGLSRALTATVLDDAAAGRPTLAPDHRTLQLAHWRAAHEGVDGIGLDAVTGLNRPGWELTERLIQRVRGALTARGDWDLVSSAAADIRGRRSAATRQRRVFARRGDPVDVVSYLAAQTVQG